MDAASFAWRALPRRKETNCNRGYPCERLNQRPPVSPINRRPSAFRKTVNDFSPVKLRSSDFQRDGKVADRYGGSFNGSTQPRKWAVARAASVSVEPLSRPRSTTQQFPGCKIIATRCRAKPRKTRFTFRSRLKSSSIRSDCQLFAGESTSERNHLLLRTNYVQR